MPARKSASSSRHKGKPATNGRQDGPKRKTVSTPSPAKSAGAAHAPIDALVKELATLRATVEKQLVTPPVAGPMDEVDAIRRLMADIIENRNSVFLQKLALIRHAAPPQSRDLLERIDALMEDMGAIPFEAERLEHLDPVIHNVAREVQDPLLPDGVIAETLQPGFRAARGRILAKALVSINRRV